MNQHVSCRSWLIAASAVAALQCVPPAMADIVATDEMAAPLPADAERAKVQAFLERSTVTQRLQAMGVDGMTAGDRVGAMSQEEVHALAQRIDALPAGGEFSNTEIVIILLAVILLALLL